MRRISRLSPRRRSSGALPLVGLVRDDVAGFEEESQQALLQPPVASTSALNLSVI